MTCIPDDKTKQNSELNITRTFLCGGESEEGKFGISHLQYLGVLSKCKISYDLLKTNYVNFDGTERESKGLTRLLLYNTKELNGSGF